MKREVERAEMLYGRLDPAQRDLIAALDHHSPYDAEIAYAERKERQQDVLSLVRRLREAGTGRDDAIAQVRAVRERHRPLAARKLPALFGARHCAPLRAGEPAAQQRQRGAAERGREEARRLSRRRARPDGRRGELSGEGHRRELPPLRRALRLDAACQCGASTVTRCGLAVLPAGKSLIAAMKSAGRTVVRPIVGPWLAARAS